MFHEICSLTHVRQEKAGENNTCEGNLSKIYVNLSCFKQYRFIKGKNSAVPFSLLVSSVSLYRVVFFLFSFFLSSFFFYFFGGGVSGYGLPVWLAR